MYTNHTPGPWTSTSPREPINIPLRAHQCERIGFSVCFINTDSVLRNAEAEANARLIAAAPDLLSALMGVMREWTTPAEYLAAGAAARDAITKATRGAA